MSLAEEHTAVCHLGVYERKLYASLGRNAQVEELIDDRVEEDEVKIAHLSTKR